MKLALCTKTLSAAVTVNEEFSFSCGESGVQSREACFSDASAGGPTEPTTESWHVHPCTGLVQ